VRLINIHDEAIARLDFSDLIIIENQFGEVIAVAERLSRESLNSVSA